MNAAIFFGREDVVADGEKICVAIDELEGEHGEALHHTLTGCHPELRRSRSEGAYVRGSRQCRECGRQDACSAMEPEQTGLPACDVVRSLEGLVPSQDDKD